MIDYAVLCQTLADWRAGRRPSLPPSATPTMPGSGTAPISIAPSGAPHESGDSGLLLVDDALEVGLEESSAPIDTDDLEASDDAAPPVDATMVYGTPLPDGGYAYPGTPPHHDES